jgi:EAL domain-containing protein (putative c-di-GMP-specific phosphodiesterase class I)/GGDEF domain-containing protein
MHLPRKKNSESAPMTSAALLHPDPLATSQESGLASLLGNGLLDAHFQPIFDHRHRRYIAFEGLMRGPAGSALHTPAALLAAAAAEGLEAELERAAIYTIVRKFVGLNLPGKLFLNVSPATLLSGFLETTAVTTILQDHSLSHSRIVLEITESQRITDFHAFGQTVRDVRRLGYQIAIDDLGEGFSSLRLWSELRPDFVKIDRHFVAGVQEDPLKFHLVRSIQEIADACQATVIAEGVETDAVLVTLRDMGIPCLQGFFIERPSATPHTAPSLPLMTLLHQPQLTVFPANASSGPQSIAQTLLRHVPPARPGQRLEDIFLRFRDERGLTVIPVTDADERVLGILQRQVVVENYARLYGREIYGRKQCCEFMERDPVQVEYDTPLKEVGQIVARMCDTSLQDGFIITREGRYLGIGRITDLVASITELQIKAARYANPLTQLPGNVPLNEHTDRLLGNQLPFAACYVDINQFKPYNDAYGYRRGDDVIQMLGQVLREVANPTLDFVAHIGGDDFMVLFQSPDWEERCLRAIATFDARRMGYLEPSHAFDGGYTGEDRRGRPVTHRIPSLAVAVLKVEPELFPSHRELAAALAGAKKMAKRKAGSCLFVERRRSLPSGTAGAGAAYGFKEPRS